MKPLYDSRYQSCKSPFGAVKSRFPVRFAIHLPKMRLDNPPVLKLSRMDVRATPFVVKMQYESSDLVCNTYSCEFVPPEPALFEYFFEVVSCGRVMGIKKGPDNAGVFNDGGGLWQLTVYDADMRAPSFLREGMFYQIFPDRFYNSGVDKQNVPHDRVRRGDWGGIPNWRPDANGEVTMTDYFGGDLAGITEKLGYLKGLGVTIIYLNPIFEAHSNHRYNTADYMKIDPLLGTQEDFSELCREAGKLGIKVILDGVFNHTGSDSLYFNKERRYGDGGAANDPNSKYRSWYQFTNYPSEYESWWGFKTLPNVNEADKSYRDFICGENGVIKHWLRLGASGFRLDVADELPDFFLDEINACIKSHSPECAMIGEVWEDASNKISYGVRRRYLLGKQFDSIMNYPFMNAIIRYIRYGGATDLYNCLMQIIENYPPPVLHSLMNMLSTHDTARALTELVGESSEGKNRGWQEAHHYLPIDAYHRGCKLYLLSSIIQFGLPGLPCVYYGDEAGLSGYRDPFNRVCYPWGHENPELIAKISELGAIRGNYPVFADADFVPVVFSEEVCVFERAAKTGERFLFAVNRTDSEQYAEIPPVYSGAEPLFVSGGYFGGKLSPLSGVVLYVV